MISTSCYLRSMRNEGICWKSCFVVRFRSVYAKRGGNPTMIDSSPETVNCPSVAEAYQAGQTLTSLFFVIALRQFREDCVQCSNVLDRCRRREWGCTRCVGGRFEGHWTRRTKRNGLVARGQMASRRRPGYRTAGDRVKAEPRESDSPRREAGLEYWISRFLMQKLNTLVCERGLKE